MEHWEVWIQSKSQVTEKKGGNKWICLVVGSGITAALSHTAPGAGCASVDAFTFLRVSQPGSLSHVYWSPAGQTQIPLFVGF